MSALELLDFHFLKTQIVNKNLDKLLKSEETKTLNQVEPLITIRCITFTKYSLHYIPVI